jgi:hypothetical protein
MAWRRPRARLRRGCSAPCAKPTGAFGLLIQGNGTEIVTDASTMDIIDKPAAPKTEVVLAKAGNDYYLDKIWIQGRTTGWQVMLPNNFNRQQSRSVELPATHQTVEQQSSASQSGQPMQSRSHANSTGPGTSNSHSPLHAR